MGETTAFSSHTADTNIGGVKSVAIIGAGPSGLSAAKYLSAEESINQVDVFEQRPHTGGLWNYTPQHRRDNFAIVPQTSPFVGEDQPVPASHGVSGAEFVSPIYERLETNNATPLMGFGDFPFPENSQLFATHDTVRKYVQAYGKGVEHMIQFNTQVVDVRLIPATASSRDSWSVTTQRFADKEVNTTVYDAVVVASGHFTVPWIPDIPGMKAWETKFPGSIHHAKYFRRPEDYSGKKVIVVGNNASGIDIGAQINTYCNKPIIFSQRKESLTNQGLPPIIGKVTHPEIVEYLPEPKRTVKFTDGSTEENVDIILYATGYLYSLPFLESLQDTSFPPIGDGTRVQHTYRHLIYRPNPTLSFLTLNQNLIPYPHSEAQSTVLAHLFTGRLTLPTDDEMRRWETKRLEETGSAGFHTLPVSDPDQTPGICLWGSQASGSAAKVLIPWTQKHLWIWENMPALRRAFVSMGEKRRGVTSVEQLRLASGLPAFWETTGSVASTKL
ncbi:unnamed protein product [Clonostachys byssicola]|uniref:FAD/NAD(P)-binding domain-containing protein n=1 Tax=Clonostachys byssicola TaxID=160290 RepID=A0A9N9UMW2_9HYPO|nr:unnamed protein product [Clonostachys byssicola]